MKKRDEIEHPLSCLNKAKDDEPLFVLRAQDKFSAALVDLWADLAELHDCDEEKVREGRSLANDMREWPKRKFPD